MPLGTETKLNVMFESIIHMFTKFSQQKNEKFSKLKNVDVEFLKLRFFGEF